MGVKECELYVFAYELVLDAHLKRVDTDTLCHFMRFEALDLLVSVCDCGLSGKGHCVLDCVVDQRNRRRSEDVYAHMSEASESNIALSDVW